MITSDDSRHGNYIQISDIYINNVELTFFYGASSFANSGEKIRVRTDRASANTYDFENDHPVFVVAEFKSDAEETGFSLSFLKMSVLHEVDVEQSDSLEIESEEETVSDRADSAFD